MGDICHNKQGPPLQNIPTKSDEKEAEFVPKLVIFLI